MSGISSKALKSATTNRRKFNGKEEQRQEFSDRSGLEWLDYGARMYDNQLMRWHNIDPLAGKYLDISPYAFVKNNPIKILKSMGDILMRKMRKRLIRWKDRLINRLLNLKSKLGS